MALERILAPSILDSLFFDDMFEEANREMVRMHHDMRHSMLRLQPRDPISAGGDSLTKQLQSLRECVSTNKDGSKEFNLNVDVNAFKPEEINVKTTGNKLSIKARHEDTNEDSSVVHEFSRMYTLPEDVDPESLVCSLSKDGIMTVKGPAGVEAIEAPPEKKKKDE